VNNGPGGICRKTRETAPGWASFARLQVRKKRLSLEFICGVGKESGNPSSKVNEENCGLGGSRDT
jgi:hypothetical protein